MFFRSAVVFSKNQISSKLVEFCITMSNVKTAIVIKKLLLATQG